MSTITIPRLKPGQGILGPDFYGCFNTGMAPLIRNSKYTGGYLVGPALYVDLLKMDAALKPSQRIFRKDGKTVYSYKSRAAAVAKFRELCEEATARNNEIAAQHHADKIAAAAGDLEAACRLMDY